MSRNNRRGAGHKKPAPSDRRPEIDPLDHWYHDDGPVEGCVYCEALSDVPFGSHETNLAPWEQPYALPEDEEHEPYFQE